MNPSYVRIHLPLSQALPRFSEWLGLPELAPPQPVTAPRAVPEASAAGEWRGTAVFGHAARGWTVFDDLTGYLASIPASRWAQLAGNEELVFAGYNDAVPHGQLIVVRAGVVEREFLQDLRDPSADINLGRLPFEAETPIDHWTDAAYFVDEDELADQGAPEGLLWIFGPPIPV